MLEGWELCDQFARHAGVLRALAREGKDDAATALGGLALCDRAQRRDGGLIQLQERLAAGADHQAVVRSAGPLGLDGGGTKTQSGGSLPETYEKYGRQILFGVNYRF